MTPEEREAIKNSEKERLRAMRRRRVVERLGASGKREAIWNIDEPQGIEDTHQEMLGMLEHATALNEARVEMALEKAEGEQHPGDSPEENARALVKQIKLQMGMQESGAEPGVEKVRQRADDPLPARNSPEKTIGRPR